MFPNARNYFTYVLDFELNFMEISYKIISNKIVAPQLKPLVIFIF